MPGKSVTFYHPRLEDSSRYDNVDLDEDWWPEFKDARAMWIGTTYVRLKQAGCMVRIGRSVPDDDIAVVFARDMPQFLSTHPGKRHPLTVCAQSDVLDPVVSLADVVVQHNGFHADGTRKFFIPNWPQPGLIPRDNGRGNTVKTVGFKGNIEQLNKDFLSEIWGNFLARSDLDFVVDSDATSDHPAFLSSGSHIKAGTNARWHDYSETDVILAVRPSLRSLYKHKPGVKLINAWHARLPAILGPEVGYRELHQTDLDYIEVGSLTDSITALERLCDDPARYAAMVETGIERSADFTVETISKRWETLLFRTLAGREPKRYVRITQPRLLPPKQMLRALKKRVFPSS